MIARYETVMGQPNIEVKFSPTKIYRQIRWNTSSENDFFLTVYNTFLSKDSNIFFLITYKFKITFSLNIDHIFYSSNL
jgi:hypothetical protein